MKSSWPVVLGFIAVAYLASWYDGKNASAAATTMTPGNASASFVAGR